MFDIDDKEIKDLARDVKLFTARGLAFATRQTLNDAAFAGRKQTVKEISRVFIERNTWTRRTLRVDKATSLDIDLQASAFGSREKYMAEQEFGHTQIKKGKHGVPIVTSYAAGQERARPRTKVTKARNRWSNLRLRRNRQRHGSPDQNLLVDVRLAVKSNQRELFLSRTEHGVTKGIYRVTGGRTSKRNHGWPKGARLKMIFSLEKTSVTTKPHKTVTPAFFIAARKLPRLYKKNLLFQLKRAGLL